MTVLTGEGRGNHRVEGVEKRGTDESGITDPDDQEQLKGGPVMSPGGALPGGGIMNNWTTASPNADATNPASMPRTRSTPLPGETEERTAV